MTYGLAFWVVVLAAFVFGGLASFRREPYWIAGSWWVLFFLVILLGMAEFGKALHP